MSVKSHHEGFMAGMGISQNLIKEILEGLEAFDPVEKAEGFHENMVLASQKLLSHLNQQIISLLNAPLGMVSRVVQFFERALSGKSQDHRFEAGLKDAFQHVRTQCTLMYKRMHPDNHATATYEFLISSLSRLSQGQSLDEILKPLKTTEKPQQPVPQPLRLEV